MRGMTDLSIVETGTSVSPAGCQLHQIYHGNDHNKQQRFSTCPWTRNVSSTGATQITHTAHHKYKVSH